MRTNPELISCWPVQSLCIASQRRKIENVFDCDGAFRLVRRVDGGAEVDAVEGAPAFEIVQYGADEMGDVIVESERGSLVARPFMAFMKLGGERKLHVDPLWNRMNEGGA